MAILANSRTITPNAHEIWLVIELGQEIMPTNNVTKFDDDPLKYIQVGQGLFWLIQGP